MQIKFDSEVSEFLFALKPGKLAKLDVEPAAAARKPRGHPAEYRNTDGTKALQERNC
jgi:hypothetical protein